MSNPSTFKQEFRQAIAPVMPSLVYQNLMSGRSSGSLLRAVIRKVGERRFDNTKKRLKRSVRTLPLGYSLGAAQKIFLNVISSQTQFKTSVLEQWHPPVDFEESWSRVEYWMRAAGYSNRG
jgi:hypothetical protein